MNVRTRNLLRAAALVAACSFAPAHALAQAPGTNPAAPSPAAPGQVSPGQANPAAPQTPAPGQTPAPNLQANPGQGTPNPQANPAVPGQVAPGTSPPNVPQPNVPTPTYPSINPAAPAPQGPASTPGQGLSDVQNLYLNPTPAPKVPSNQSSPTQPHNPSFRSRITPPTATAPTGPAAPNPSIRTGGSAPRVLNLFDTNDTRPTNR